ncbi:MAG: family 20 glycosylhydrolase [Acidobacteriota bacterium]|jgi:hypothetical protein|nr:family 20 glycosylhydrolase [Acidobacteriota bacterium]
MIGQHVFLYSARGADALVSLIDEYLGPMGVTLIVAEVNYNYQYESHPELSDGDLDPAAAGRVADACERHGIRLVPMLNCLGHQSWAETTYALLREHPEFDETPQIPLDNPDIYCRSWCPLHPQVNGVVFDLMDELIEGFRADAFHVGMDEVFLIASEQCERCRGKRPADLFATAVNDYHAHLVGQRGVEMMIWGDRLIDGRAMLYGSWEASLNDTAEAMTMIPKDIIICDWHYEPRDSYPSVPHFAEDGFRVLVSPWKDVAAAELLVGYAQESGGAGWSGVLFTGWSAGDGGLGLLRALCGEAEEGAGGTGEAAVLRAILPRLVADDGP